MKTKNETREDLLVIAQLVERSTVDRLVAGSNPAREKI